jgi:C4-dicarboxylate-binding protein DctP
MNKGILVVTVLVVLALIAGTAGCGDEETTPAPDNGVMPTLTPEPITLKMISASPGTGAQAYSYFADLVEDYTDGRVLIDFYPNSQLFPGTEQWEALVTGAVDILADSTYWFRNAVPDVLVFYVDGLWESYEHAYAVLEESELPRELAERLEEAAPVKILGIQPTTGLMCILNSVKETEQLKDLEGLRAQAQPGFPASPIYDYIGMVPVPIAVEEVSTAFIQGILDAVQYPPATMRDLRLYEIGKHALCRYSMFVTSAVVMNNSSWEILPADIQDIILTEVMPEVYEYTRTLYREEEDAAVVAIELNVETMHWVTEEDYAPYFEYLPTHPVQKTLMLMIDPEIVQIVDDLRPSRQGS